MNELYPMHAATAPTMYIVHMTVLDMMQTCIVEDQKGQRWHQDNPELARSSSRTAQAPPHRIHTAPVPTVGGSIRDPPVQLM